MYKLEAFLLHFFHYEWCLAFKMTLGINSTDKIMTYKQVNIMEERGYVGI